MGSFVFAMQRNDLRSRPQRLVEDKLCRWQGLPFEVHGQVSRIRNPTFEHISELVLEFELGVWLHEFVLYSLGIRQLDKEIEDHDEAPKEGFFRRHLVSEE